MLKIGCNLSISKGYYKTAQEAISIGANTFQFSPRNPRGRKAKDLDGVLREVDDVVGIERLKAVHLNDSKVKITFLRSVYK